MSQVLTQFRELAIGASFLSRDKKAQLVKVSETQAAIDNDPKKLITISAVDPVWRIDP